MAAAGQTGPGTERPDRASPRRRLSRRIAAALAISLLVLAVGVIGIRSYMGRAKQDRLREGEVADFTSLALTPVSPRFVMCPKLFCDIPGDAESPVFDLSWDELRDAWSEMVAVQPRLRLIAGDGEMTKITYIQHTALLDLPDIVTVQFISLDEHHSTFAIISQARYHYIDLGGNGRRIRSWVLELQQALKGRPPPPS